MVNKACKDCGMISSGPICPDCKSSNLSEDWSGLVIIFKPTNSEVAKRLSISKPGKYAIRVR